MQKYEVISRADESTVFKLQAEDILDASEKAADRFTGVEEICLHDGFETAHFFATTGGYIVQPLIAKPRTRKKK